MYEEIESIERGSYRTETIPKFPKHKESTGKEIDMVAERKMKTSTLKISSWNISSLSGKEMELVEEVENSFKTNRKRESADRQVEGRRAASRLQISFILLMSITQRQDKERVGILDLAKKIIKYEAISFRIIVHLELDEQMVILQIYQPVEEWQVSIGEIHLEL